MKILYVVQAYHPSRGGVQWLVQNLAERMTAVYGDEVTVFTTTAYDCNLFIDRSQRQMQPGVETISGVTVRRFPVFNRFTGWRLNAARVGYKLRLPGQDWLRTLYFGPIVPNLRQAIATSDADVIVASSFPMRHMYDALHAGQSSSKPVVFIGTVHPTDPWGYDLPCMFRAIKTAAAYIALSRHELAYLTQHGVPPAQIQIIGAGIDEQRYRHAAAAGTAWRQQHGWDDDPVLLMLGRQTAYKRPDLLLAAMQQVWPRLPAARLVIAGARSRYSKRLARLIADLPQQQRERVTMLDDFAEADKPALLAACNVLAHPSERESFGIVFLEAWAAGRPVIGARSGAAPTIIDEGVDGLLATYGDEAAWAEAICQLLTDAALRQRLGKNGQHKVAERYTWTAVLQQHRRIYEKVAA